jgi:uncharacterized protein
VRYAVVGLLCLTGGLFGQAAQANSAHPSFDCGKAATPVERLICSSDVLSQEDMDLAAAFRASREGVDDATRADRLHDQRHWLQSRLTTCGIPLKGDIPAGKQAAAGACLSNLTKARIAALGALGAAKPASAPSVAATGVAAQSAGSTPAPTPAAVGSGGDGTGLAKTLFAAQGDNETLLSVGTFGRYSIMVKSDQGTALQLVDRMAGPSPVDGSAGHGDGRIDTFLDRGSYKVRLHSDPRGSGDAELSVVPSAELNPTPQQLVPLKTITTELDDHQQRSYWIDVKERRLLVVEAAGRFLDDLRLWKDGNWLVDATPEKAERDPVGGQPLAIRTLSVWLEPGLYRLVAYGGVGEKWSIGSTDKPLYLRAGIPSMPEASRALHVTSPFGVDRWVVPVSATYFRIDLDKSEPAVLTVGDYQAEQPFDIGGDSASIDKTSRNPSAVVDLDPGSSSAGRIVTVAYKPGGRYRLQYFDDSHERSFDKKGAGSYWLATLQAGGSADALDPTAIIVKDRHEVTAASTIELDPQQGWRRKFNLLKPVFVFLHATQPMDVVLGGTGADAEYRITPFLVDGNDDNAQPDWQGAGATWWLDAGYWVLSVEPRDKGKGVLDLVLKPKTATADPVEQPRRPAPLFPDLTLDSDHGYTAYLSETGEAYGGASLKDLPLDLSKGLSFELAGGASIDVPAFLRTEGRLDASDEAGKPIALTIDGKPAGAGPELASGRHEIALAAPAGGPIAVTLGFTPARLLASTPLPALDPARLAGVPSFPVLAPDSPAYLDLQHNETASFEVKVAQPALYRLESTGIIETAGAIRTRTITALDSQQANGIGRNFLIQQYLREGEYQLSVQAPGQSFGPIGVGLSATPIADFGELQPEVTVRATLQPGQAGRYRFHIATAGAYSLQTLGLHHGFTMRLDDADGWPILAPGSIATGTLPLAAGDYQMVLLPRPVESRAVTVLQRLVDPVQLSGHGPFAFTLGETLGNRWMEPAPGQKRIPDRWTFTLPAPAEISMAVDNGMRATITGGTPGGEERVAFAERSWTGQLPAGDYTVEVVSAAPNNRVDYTLSLDSTELLAGQTVSVTTPISLPVSVGRDHQVEFASYGGEDVKARLYDAAGKLVAANDDRDNDWNFLIPVRLLPGRYTLRVDPAEGGGTPDTIVSMIEPAETQDPTLSLGRTVTIADGQIHIVPLADIRQDGLVVLTAEAATAAGLSLEARQADGTWVTLGSTSGSNPYLALPVSSGQSETLRARVWTIEHGKLPIAFTASFAEPAALAEKALAGGKAVLPSLPGVPGGLSAAAVTLGQPGALRLGTGGAGLLWSTTPGVPARHDGEVIIAGGKTLWLVTRGQGAKGSHVQAGRIDPDRAADVHLVLSGRDPVVLPIAAKGKPGAVALWQVQGQGGQPGLAVRQLGTDGAPLMAVGPASPVLGSAVAIAPATLSKPVVEIWNADGGDAEMPVTLSRVAFAAPKPSSAGFGIDDGTFTGRQAQLWALPAGLKRISIVLPAGSVAVPYTGGTPEQMIWAVSDRTEIVETAADHLLLLHPDPAPAPFSVTVEPLGQAATILLRPGTAASRYSPIPAVLHLKSDAGPAGRLALRLSGSATDMTILGADGSVARGTTGILSAGGTLAISYDPGLFAFGLDAEGGPADTAAVSPVAVTAPASLPLSGARMRFSVAGGASRLLHVASDMPLLLRASGAGTGRTLYSRGAALNLLQAAGKTIDIEVEPTGMAALSGTLQISATDLTPMGEGLGPKRRLAPGESRAFSFTLATPHTIGVGVRASVDVATCRLLRADGTEIGEGLVSMHDLGAGTYVLVVDAPADGPAIDIEPALVGSVLPDKGPPDAVKASYLALVGQPANQ